MVKGNESDVGNTDFELQAKSGDFLIIYIVFELQRIVHITATRCLIEKEFTFRMDNSRCCLFKMPPTTGRNINFFYPHIWEMSKVIYKKTLSGVFCMKPCTCIYNKCMLITQDCVKFRGCQAQAYCTTEISCKQLCWFPGCSAGKKSKILFSCWWRLELVTSLIELH